MIYIQDILTDVVAEVSAEMMPIISTSERASTATGVHFKYGHEKEIAARLIRMGNGQEARDKYPLIWLYTPFVLTVDKANPGYQLFKGNILVINGSKADLISPQRYAENFKPIIHPIVECFVKKLDSFTYGRYKPFDTNSMSYEQIDHDYWGATQASAENKLLDFLDATELNNLELRVKPKNC